MGIKEKHGSSKTHELLNREGAAQSQGNGCEGGQVIGFPEPAEDTVYCLKGREGFHGKLHLLGRGTERGKKPGIDRHQAVLFGVLVQKACKGPVYPEIVVKGCFFGRRRD